jgi:NAD(P)-dependent dehydrogenase (short-subunit alcohol dehydrogenase family)
MSGRRSRKGCTNLETFAAGLDTRNTYQNRGHAMTGAALVTGARRGIGKAIAMALAEAGFAVAVNDAALSDELSAVSDEIRSGGGKCAAVAGDISDLAQHARMFDEAEAAIGPLSTLINNAGVSVLNRGDLLDVSPESYDRCLDINTRGTFFLTQAFAKRLLARQRLDTPHHSIITISSANAAGVSINRGEYCVSKAGVSMTSKLFAARLSNEGIGVYEIQPGFIETDMTAPSKARYDDLMDRGLTVIKRWGTPQEVAKIAVTMATAGCPTLVPDHRGRCRARRSGIDC